MYKQFYAAAIVMLAQQGKLSLDDDVRKHVPELPDYGARITVRDLLTHPPSARPDTPRPKRAPPIQMAFQARSYSLRGGAGLISYCALGRAPTF